MDAAGASSGYRQVASAPSTTVTVVELNAGAVDPRRIAIQQAHSGEQLGALLSFSATGAATISATPGGQYDVFVMNSSSGVSYDCLDYDGERGAGGIAGRYATLRRATPSDAGLPALLHNPRPSMARILLFDGPRIWSRKA